MVLTTYDKIGAAATQAGQRIQAANDAASSGAGKVAQGVSNAFGVVKGNLANFSYQMQDIAVQLGSGQSPLVVLMQQGTQIASLFGPTGALIGAIGAGVGLLLSHFGSAEQGAEQAKEKAYEFGDSLEWLGRVAATTSGEIGKLIDAYRKASAESQTVLRLKQERTVRDLEDQLDAARGDTQALLDQLHAPKTVPLGKMGTTQVDLIPADQLAAIQDFAKGGSITDAVVQLDQLAKSAGVASDDKLRELADKLLDVAGNAEELQARLANARTELNAMEGAVAGQTFPLNPDIKPPADTPPARGGAVRPVARPLGGGEFDAAKLEGARLGDFQTDLQAEIDATRQRIIQRNQLEQKGLQERNDLRLQAERESLAELAKYDEEQARIQAQRAPIMEPIEGARSKFKELADESQEYGRLIGQSIQLAADTGAKALSAFILEGKSGLKDLAKTAADQLLTGAFSFLINALVGTGGTALMNAFAPASTPLVTPGNTGSSALTYGGPHARGGSVRDDRWYWVGENGPERFVPHTAGSIVPANAAGGGGTVVQVIDQRRGTAPAVETQRSRGPNGMEQIKLVIRDTVAEMGQDGGLDKAMRGRYGQRPVPKR